MSKSVKFGGSSKFTVAPKGTHNAVLCEVYGPKWDDKYEKDQGRFIFQIEARIDNPDSDFHDERIQVNEWFNWTLGTPGYPSKLRDILNDWRGQIMSDQQLREAFDDGEGGVDLERLEGVCCEITVTHRPKEGGGVKPVYAYAPPVKKDMKPENYRTVAEREAQKANVDALKGEQEPEGGQEIDDGVPF